MSDFQEIVPTKAERGDTVGKSSRWVLRVVVLVIALSSVGGIAQLREKIVEKERTAIATGGAVLSPETQSMASQAEVLDREEGLIRSAVASPKPGSHLVDGVYVLAPRAREYSLSSLIKAGVAERGQDGVVEVQSTVVVRKGARLRIDAPGTTLRLHSGAAGIANLVAWGGELNLRGSAQEPLIIESWDPEAGREDRNVDDGRAFVLARSGMLRVKHLAARHLGFWSGRTGGLAVTGSEEFPGQARLSDVTISDQHAGLFLDNSEGVQIKRVAIYQPRWYGVYVAGSSGLRVNTMAVTGAGAGGISIRDGSSNISLTDVAVERSAGRGLEVDGRPRGSGVNAAGYGPTNYAGLALNSVRLRLNTAGGLRIRGMDDVTLTAADVHEDWRAIRIFGPSIGFQMRQSVVTTTAGRAVVVRGGVRNLAVVDSRVRAKGVGIEVDRSDLSLRGGAITVDLGHGVLARESNVTATATEISGAGSSAISVSGGEKAESKVGGSWSYRPQVLQWVVRNFSILPILPVVPVLTIGIILIVRRSRAQVKLRRMLAEAMLAEGQQRLAEYQLPQQRLPSDGGLPGSVDTPRLTLLPTSLPGKTAEELAVAAVTQLGYSPARVARVLGVPTSRVRNWIDGTVEPDDQNSVLVGPRA